jgi:hypothetical protein
MCVITFIIGPKMLKECADSELYFFEDPSGFINYNQLLSKFDFCFVNCNTSKFLKEIF